MGDLAGLLGGGVVGVAIGFASLVVWWARATRADDEATERTLRRQYNREAADHRAERTRLQNVIDTERAGRRAAEDEAATERSRRREAEDETARLRRLVRELGGEPG